MSDYDVAFFELVRRTSLKSARVIVPLVLDLLPVQSVCDLGCGVGAWLRIFEEQGVKEIIGMDGDYVDTSQLEIPQESFVPTNLIESVELRRRYDLAISLEVAEHLPESRARSFVRDLTRVAPVVLFSAAIPGQGGVNHVNEQWQSYWASLFADLDYVATDPIRAHIWNNVNVSFWYRQNLLVYCERSVLGRFPKLAAAASMPLMLDVIHPALHNRHLSPGV
jgi:hypothetical protein